MRRIGLLVGGLLILALALAPVVSASDQNMEIKEPPEWGPPSGVEIGVPDEVCAPSFEHEQIGGPYGGQCVTVPP